MDVPRQMMRIWRASGARVAARRASAGGAALLAAILLTACGGQETQRQADRDAIRAMLLRFHDSLVTGDLEMHMSCLLGNDDEMAVAASRFEFYQAAYDFEDRLVSLHGQRAWRAFEARTKVLRAVPSRQRRYWEGLRVHIMPDGRARLFGDMDVPQFHVVQGEDGDWYIPGFVARHARLSSVLAAQDTQTRLTREYLARLDEHTDLRQLADEMAEDFRQAMDAIVDSHDGRQ